MGSQITDYYENDLFIKRVERITPDIELVPVGELLSEPKITDMVYEDNVLETIKLLINQIKKKRKNILQYGSAGTGKTTTAKVFAVETNRPFIYLTGSMAKQKIVSLLLSAKENSIILIDEIHNLPDRVAEIIYPAIQENEVYLDGERKVLKNIMFVGTTTEPEGLPKPLLERFKHIELEELSEDKLREVLVKKGCKEKCAEYILNFTTNFRIINNLLEMIKLYGEINEQNLVKVFRLKKINLYSGLSDLQEKYLEILKKQKKIGLRNLAIHLRKSEDYIKYEVEVDLIRKGMIVITSRGRELNPEFSEYGYEQLKKEEEKHHSKYSNTERESARKWLKEHPKIKEQFGDMYLELESFIAEKIKEGIEPDMVDFESFGTDTSLENSYENNYSGVLEEL